MSVAITEKSASPLAALQPLWHESAPRSLRKVLEEELLSRKSTAWRKHLAGRKRPDRPPFLRGKLMPLFWELPEVAAVQREAANLFRSPDSAADSVYAAWRKTDAAVVAHGEISSAIRGLALAYALPDLAQRMSPATWWSALEAAYELAVDADRLQIDDAAPPDSILCQQLLAGELPLALSYLFPELRALRELGSAAQDILSQALVELTDGQGLPHGRLLSVLGPLWACWTRARWMGARMKQNCWSAEAEVQYQWLVRHALRLTDGQGRLMLSNRHPGRGDHDNKAPSSPAGLYRMALELAGDRSDYAAASAALPKQALPHGASKRTAKRHLPEISLNSEWSAVAVLASDWSRSAVRFAAAWAGPVMQIELNVGRERLWFGDWTYQTACSGEAVSALGEWEQSCWQSDRICDYLELHLKLSHGLRLERQVLLARRERVLYLADVLVEDAGSGQRLSHHSRLPMAPAARWLPEAETRDGVLVSGKQRAAVLPVALAEWRCDPRSGGLTLENGYLILSQERTGRAMNCPLVLDLDRPRSKRQRTWRQLTVAESLQAVSADVAVGYRAQSGADQWIFYRSLGAAANRTVIGQNIAGEFCAGRLKKSGMLDEWIEIEACE